MCNFCKTRTSVLIPRLLAYLLTTGFSHAGSWGKGAERHHLPRKLVIWLADSTYFFKGEPFTLLYFFPTCLPNGARPELSRARKRQGKQVRQVSSFLTKATLVRYLNRIYWLGYMLDYHVRTPVHPPSSPLLSKTSCCVKSTF